jgi:hypothetical protein
LLRLFAETNATVDVATLMQEMDAIWRRTPNYSWPSWRQVTVVPEVPLSLDRSNFVALFPEAALTDEEFQHGFPFVDYGLPPAVFGINPAGWWQGTIPLDRSQAPQYLWLFKRDGRFAYREKSWEDNMRSVTNGHIDITSMLAVALATSFFLRKVARKFGLSPDTKYVMQIDFEGANGRGLVEPKFAGGHPILLHGPPLVSSSDRVSGAAAFTISELDRDPVLVGLAPVGELAASLNPALGADDALRALARAGFRHNDFFRTFGYLKGHEVVKEPEAPKKRR